MHENLEVFRGLLQGVDLGAGKGSGPSKGHVMQSLSFDWHRLTMVNKL